MGKYTGKVRKSVNHDFVWTSGFGYLKFTPIPNNRAFSWIIIVRKGSYGKVMFSYVFFCSRGVCLPTMPCFTENTAVYPMVAVSFSCADTENMGVVIT